MRHFSILSKWILFFFCAIACMAIDESLYEMGTMEHPKEDLPYNDDVIVKTLVFPIAKASFIEDARVLHGYGCGWGSVGRPLHRFAFFVSTQG